jgi:hypothetical protein
MESGQSEKLKKPMPGKRAKRMVRGRTRKTTGSVTRKMHL